MQNLITLHYSDHILSKPQALDADPKAMKQINFTGNLDCTKGAWMVFILEEVKEANLDF